jgi:hopanoid biosynthesis associated protein HpnK
LRNLIVSADDFGLSPEVNEAVERAHRDGILSSASLMVAAPATAEAIDRARALPSLRVGLHVVLVNGRSLLAPELIPGLVDRDGALMRDLAAAGIAFFFRPGIRGQLEAEIRAQFEAFRASGLPLDHVNAQNHMHVHPTVFGIILKVGREYGVHAIRIPYEPFGPSWRSVRTKRMARWCNAALLAPWLGSMKRRLKRCGIASNDYVFGMIDTGHMTSDRVLAYLENVPDGVTELYFHPAMRSWPDVVEGMKAYDFAGEYRALIDRRVIDALAASTICQTTYGGLARVR